MAQMALVFQEAHHAAYGRVRRRIRQLLQNVTDRGLAQAEDHVHDLPLAAAQFGMYVCGLWHCWFPLGWLDEPCANRLARASTLAQEAGAVSRGPANIYCG